jgi:DNA-binding transcriptional ArsR family regulator
MTDLPAAVASAILLRDTRRAILAALAEHEHGDACESVECLPPGAPEGECDA